MRRLLRSARRDADEVCDEVRCSVWQRLGGDGVLMMAETGFPEDLKKGNRSAGVQRQCAGTAGRSENARVGVFLTHACAGSSTWPGSSGSRMPRARSGGRRCSARPACAR
ncbi:transposase [Streptomyces sp. SL13]|uniref:Transposase n=1 Tax=Streptantibioticus silvisoli TaxID=2705255 RepID=A0AA90H9S2_9ACTN|nr:transposase [Streptantibioticus silvisoli]MDI5973891.1 transposase [Streptantibioticus silvisoli]